jgi:tRNA(adenine34) deaminase
MRLAIEQAKLAYDMGEVPVGAVIVKNGEIVSCGFNKRETLSNALFHAEIEAIDGACKKLSSWRLDGCELYVTLEPCPMCAGAILNSRISTVVFGASDPKAGCFGSLEDFSWLVPGSKPLIIRSVLAKECAELIGVFFKNLRQ